MIYRRVGIIGHAALAIASSQFEPVARWIIQDILNTAVFEYPLRKIEMVSGLNHMGGVDVWAAEIATKMGIETKLFKPRYPSWALGYKPRNISIVHRSHELHVIGMWAQGECYHCMHRGYYPSHRTSAGCWTAWHALSKPTDITVTWHIIGVDGSIVERKVNGDDASPRPKHKHIGRYHTIVKENK